MKSILKSLVTANSAKRWENYRRDFKQFFKERDSKYDETIDYLESFVRRYDEIPDWGSIFVALQEENPELCTYLSDLVSDPAVLSMEADTDFFAYTERTHTAQIRNDSMAALKKSSNLIQMSEVTSSVGMLEELEVAKTQISKVIQKATLSNSSKASMIYHDSGNDLASMYNKNKLAAQRGERLYYDIGFTHFEEFDLKMGDLVVIGGFTSHGKSVMLRWFTYNLIINHGLNIAFWTMEMPYEECRMLFSLLHANNKKIFPNTPYLKAENYRKGLLTDEEEDFLFNVADADFRSNPNYGTLWLEQPDKPRYRLSDLKEQVEFIQTNIMPLDGIMLDYLTLMYPIESERGKPDVSDYNQLFKDYKQLGLANKDLQGKPHPIITGTVCQISRMGFEKAQKEEGKYDLSALSHYSEIERSADAVFTVYTPIDFRDLNKMRLQHLKARSSRVVAEPTDLFCEFSNSYNIYEVQNRSEATTIEVLKQLKI